MLKPGDDQGRGAAVSLPGIDLAIQPGQRGDNMVTLLPHGVQLVPSGALKAQGNATAS